MSRESKAENTVTSTIAEVSYYVEQSVPALDEWVTIDCGSDSRMEAVRDDYLAQHPDAVLRMRKETVITTALSEIL